MATDTTSVAGQALAFITGGGLVTLIAALIALIPPARKARQDDRQYELDQRKAQDAEEIALRAEMRALRSESDGYRKRAIEAEEALHKRIILCQASDNFCTLTDAERARRAIPVPMVDEARGIERKKETQ